MANCNKSHKSFWEYAKKLLSLSLCLAVLSLGIPLGKVTYAESAEENLSLPDTAFITKKKLLKLCEETNVVDGKPTGLLATGKLKEDGGTDVKLRINFGVRPEDAVYYYDGWETANQRTAFAGPTTWLIAGSEKFTPAGHTEETDGLVIYSEAPLVSAYKLRGDSKMNSIFQTDEPADVYANHWGASNLRTVLQEIYAGDTAPYKGFFDTTEKGLMSTSTIKTNDHQTGSAVEYTTTDVLYAPRCNSSQVLSSWENADVGGADTLSIDKAHWGGRSWLRSPSPFFSDDALVALPGYCVGSNVVYDGYPAISAAFRLNLSSVLFTSAASAASSDEGGKFSKISADTPMTLRLGSKPSDNAPEYPFTDEHKIDVRGAKLTYSAPAGCRLMVLATGAHGNVFQHSIAIDEAVSNETVDLLEIAGLTSGKDLVAKAWLEADIEDGGSLTYATPPVTVKPPIETEVTLANGVLQRVRVYDPYDVLPEDVKFSAEYNQTSGFFNDGELGLTWHNYDLTLTSGGQSLSQLAAPVTLRFEAVKGIEAADSAVTRINELAKTNLHPTSVTDENGTVWVEVTTDHFSRYILVTGRRAARILLAGIATLLILALGFTIKFVRKKKKN